MRSPDEIYADIEADRLSREAEVRLIERLLNAAASDDEGAMLRRSLVLLTYAHVEGFTKFAMLAYVSALNSLKIRCADATFPIVAASLTRVFAALRNPNSKHAAFKRRLPDDGQLHLAAREQEFIEHYESIVGQHVTIADNVVDTKSNLSPDVLRKMLFLLGLSYPAVDEHAGPINRLLGVRNAIAHGDRLKIPTDEELSEYTSSAFVLMKFLQGEVYGALKSGQYFRAVGA